MVVITAKLEEIKSVFFIPNVFTILAIQVFAAILTKRLIDNNKPTHNKGIPNSMAYTGETGYKMASPIPAKAITPLDFKALLVGELWRNDK